MGDTTFRPRSWAPRILGVISMLAALPGATLPACAGCADELTASYGALQVIEHRGPGRHVAKVLLAGHSRARPPSPERLPDFLLLAKIQLLGIGVLSAMLLVAGIGQVLYRPWGRSLSVTWGLLALVFALVEVVILVPEYGAQAVAICEQMVGTRDAVQSCPSIPFGELMLWGLGAAIYPLINAVYFSTNSAREAMRP